VRFPKRQPRRQHRWECGRWVDGKSANDDTLADILHSRPLSFKLIFCVCYTFSSFRFWSLTCVFVRHAPKATGRSCPTSEIFLPLLRTRYSARGCGTNYVVHLCRGYLGPYCGSTLHQLISVVDWAAVELDGLARVGVGGELRRLSPPVSETGRKEPHPGYRLARGVNDHQMASCTGRSKPQAS
jgi:hypothetical protein